MRKIRLVGASPKRKVKLTPPAKPILYMISQPTCPLCCAAMFVAWENIDNIANTATVEHCGGEYSVCPNRGKKFRYSIPSVEVVEV